jgi:hypothetical protein
MPQTGFPWESVSPTLDAAKTDVLLATIKDASAEDFDAFRDAVVEILRRLMMGQSLI